MIHHILKILAASALAALPFAALAGDRTVDFAKGDPVMAEAVAAARDTLPAFLTHAFSADGTALREAQLKGHLRGALNLGLKPAELRETLIHVAHYAGWSTGVIGMKALDEVIAERAAAAKEAKAATKKKSA